MRRRSIILAAAAAAAPVLSGGEARAAGRLPKPPPPTQQVVVVRGTGASISAATVETFAKSGGRWLAVSGALPARIARNGFSADRREGDGTTPTGVYAFGETMYGIAADPGVRFRYHQLAVNDWWNCNPTSPRYNSFEHTSVDPGGDSEPLWRISPQYTHFAVVTYNMPPTVPTPVPYAGSGIFLHEHSTSGGPTAGCVSLRHDHLVSVLRWLDPARKPRIVLGGTVGPRPVRQRKG
ncbi:L,D-transpeptidase family protein [Actinomycetes bacterium KLBMP 9797]